MTTCGCNSATIRRTAPRPHPAQLRGLSGGGIAVQRTGFVAGPEGNAPAPRVDEHVHLVSERREPFGDRRDMDRSASRARHGLVDGGVQDPHREPMVRLKPDTTRFRH